MRHCISSLKCSVVDFFFVEIKKGFSSDYFSFCHPDTHSTLSEHFMSREMTSIDVSSGVGSVCVELVFLELPLWRTTVAFDLSSWNRPILRAPSSQ